MTSKPVVVVGSVNMDLVVRCARLPRPGETVLGREFLTVPGGKGANQAVAAARLGAAVEFVGAVGADSFGEQAAAALRAEQVGLRHVRRIDGISTGVAVISVSDDGENCITVAPGANYALHEADIDAAADCIRGAAVLVCQLEIPLAVVRRAIDVACAAGVTVLLNPAPAAPLPDAMLAAAHVLIPNEGEAAALAGVQDAGQAAEVLRRRGARTVVVTLGANGVLSVDQQGARRFAAYPARAVDTTGAGDAFVGALAAALAEGENLHDAIDFAQRAAAFSVERRGAQDAMARRSELASRRDAPRATS